MTDDATLDARTRRASPGTGTRARGDRAVGVWLLVCAACVLSMVLAGGITRLTHSGLSITQWQPVTGTIPPIGEPAWSDAFARYKATPEYQAINAGMDIAGYKQIYLVEWGHRLLGRATGVVFAVPLVWFFARRRVRGARLLRLCAVFGLGGLQGAVGWWMVRSGLEGVPRVSPFRLAAHLLVAVVLLGLLVGYALDELDPPGAPAARADRLLWARRLATALLGALGATLVWGALMAGLHAGHVAPTFPTMNGAWIPPGMGDHARDLFENPTTVHFLHRALGYSTAALALATAGVAWRASRDALVRRRALALALLVATQLVLGVLTVLGHVPVLLAVVHQGNAMLLVACAVMLLRRTRARGSPW